MNFKAVNFLILAFAKNNKVNGDFKQNGMRFRRQQPEIEPEHMNLGPEMPLHNPYNFPIPPPMHPLPFHPIMMH
jgi:hypothetical protein